MGTVIFVEILNESGEKVRERLRLERFPITIGRAYDNQVIIDDRFVSPHHAMIDLNADGQIVVRDLQSENGLFTATRQKITELPITGETLLRLGRTNLRLRSPQWAVAPTMLDRQHSVGSSKWLRDWRVLVLLLLVIAGLDVLDGYLNTFTRIKVEQLILLLFPSALAVSIWAGLWALTGRIFSHTSCFLRHATIAALALLALHLLDWTRGYYSFAFSADASATWLLYGGWAAIATLLLFGHLRTFLTTSPKRLATICGSIVIMLMALSVTTYHVMDDEMNSVQRLHYNPDLKPIDFKFVASWSIEDFVERGATLKEKADLLARED